VKKTLKNIVNKKNKNSKQELKASMTTLRAKEYFYKSMATNDDWRIYAIVLDKKLLYKKHNPVPSHHKLYNIIARNIIEQVTYEHMPEVVNLIVDRCKSADDRKEFDTFIELHLASLLPLDTKLIIRHQSSHESHGLQAVDMFAWGVLKKYELNNTDWYNVYFERISSEERYP
jgi:hypothetical protein